MIDTYLPHSHWLHQGVYVMTLLVVIPSYPQLEQLQTLIVVRIMR